MIEEIKIEILTEIKKIVEEKSEEFTDHWQGVKEGLETALEIIQKHEGKK